MSTAAAKLMLVVDPLTGSSTTHGQTPPAASQRVPFPFGSSKPPRHSSATSPSSMLSCGSTTREHHAPPSLTSKP